MLDVALGCLWGQTWCPLCPQPHVTPAALCLFVLPSSCSLKEKPLQDLSSLNLTEILLGLGMSLPSSGSDGAFDVSV